MTITTVVNLRHTVVNAPNLNGHNVKHGLVEQKSDLGFYRKYLPNERHD